MKKKLFFVACFALALFVSSCDTENQAISPAETDMASLEMLKDWSDSDIVLPDMEETIQMMKRQTVSSSRSGTGLVNGGFENGSTGWTYFAEGHGIDGDLSKAWIFGPSDPNGADFTIYQGGMPHVESLAHSGLNGASAVENSITRHFMIQTFTVPPLNCPEESISLSYWMRWKNQAPPPGVPAPSWIPNYQDIQVRIEGEQDGEDLFLAATQNSPKFSGGGNLTEAYFEPFSFDITEYAGEEVTIGFVISAALFYLYVDIDDVCINVILCPEDALAALATDIADLVASGGLSGGHGTALTNKLNSTLQKLAQGNTNAAIAKLQSIINQTTDLITNGHISAADGQAIIDAVTAVISQL